MATEVVYERELRIRAAPETVFELLVDPKGYNSWMGFGADFDPRPGGRFEVDMGSGVQARGEFLELVPGRKVSLRWGWMGGVIPAAPDTRVEFTLIPDGEHTILRFRHSGLTPALRAFHAYGWDRYLPRLAAVSEGRDPGVDPLAAGPPAELVATLLQTTGPRP